ncbi:hypothetical protein BX616_008709 [Lobosporangium transversale]|uniref:BLOC-1-related complex subunit 6 C-terminal helix domain-containing protein n=1 Tax=Lobosporangium transversale TaxID=64571 RepID=A0A1Y2H201_9FUNG|nr:hypothetical protein BCR41DRAFT_418975 [Lobosporangium transversale]KAF9914227.1 hypothetical protein BX616_008709 [Lobosporangium transversale]ORZ28011.1 hypothetical protein BCR41DRAFT_418975 [Lobosporangium transversale]|eukprot:XP_021885714.1 hypothetical protein BCR41DRAFT_418975 [Lobosporangium transversale]
MTIGNSIPIDVSLLEDMEQSALQLSSQLEALLSGIQANLQRAAAATLGSVKVYESTLVDGVCEQVKACVEQTTDLISRCDEMDKDMASVVAVAAQVRAIKQAVDILGSSLNKK